MNEYSQEPHVLPRRFKKPVEHHPNNSGCKFRYGAYFPLTDLVIYDMGERGTGKPRDVEWIDIEPYPEVVNFDINGKAFCYYRDQNMVVHGGENYCLKYEAGYLTYREVANLAGYVDRMPTIVYHSKNSQGILSLDKTVELQEGMRFTAVMTGNA